MTDCPLCLAADETLVWRDGSCRVILVSDADYPGFCRVVWGHHAAEMTDLTPGEQRHLLNVVLATEAALRQLMRPDKINLASLGNMVPHLHWHVIPRFADDTHFPQSVWSAPQRTGARRAAPSVEALAATLVAMLTEQTAG
ncbi:HIT domain-containing protein [Aromatoleum toluvorans]|uniref:HIT domain-containing protein n=1 Tax=Aromatoleum toluvorans TaxID=92002 RepID=A0ABX1PSX9_9RHOO|nr:HIT domain-containing protein [Aromatoleum toluvorans]